MMSVNIRNFVRKYNKRVFFRFIEFIIVVCVFLGVFMTSDVLNVIRYLLSILVQVGLIIKLLGRSRKIGCSVGGYMTVLFVILLITVSFFVVESELSIIVNRIGTLIAVFGVVIVGEKSIDINIQYIICSFAKWYVLLAVIINLDAVRFMITQTAIWKPISYLGFRYMGPFGDPNFMALYSATVLLVLWKLNEFKRGFRIFGVIVLVINIILANALSTYLVLLLTVVINKIWKERSIFKKQVALLFLYSVCMLVYINFSEEIETQGVFLLEKVYGNYTHATIKYSSLVGRLDTQAAGLEIAVKEWIGQGPLQIVPQLGRDTHNSYVGFFFEQGILGLILILISFKPKRCNSVVVNYVSTYLMLSAMLLNVHYTTIFSLCLIMQYMEFDGRDEKNIVLRYL